jgi:23S rRNA (guanosine2251-2'-O)-methyltransferase
MLKKTMDELGREAPEEVLGGDKHPVVVILDEIRSMHNVGSVFRTCDSFGVAKLLLCGYTPTPPHRDIHKTALGATDSVAWVHYATTLEAVAAARADGYRVLAVEQAHGSVSLEQLDASGKKVAFVFGNEVTGVDAAVLSVCDGCVEIPQWGSKHSLNISVTVGVVLWEMVRLMPHK